MKDQNQINQVLQDSLQIMDNYNNDRKKSLIRSKNAWYTPWVDTTRDDSLNNLKAMLVNHDKQIKSAKNRPGFS